MGKLTTTATVLMILIISDVMMILAAVVPVDVPETVKAVGTMFIGMAALVGAIASIVGLFRIQKVGHAVNSALDEYKREAAAREAAVLKSSIEAATLTEQAKGSLIAKELLAQNKLIHDSESRAILAEDRLTAIERQLMNPKFQPASAPRGDLATDHLPPPA